MLRTFLSTKSVNSTSGSFGLLVLRVLIGVLMLVHGMGKLSAFSAMTPHFDGIFLGMGGGIALSLVIFAELFCSIGLILGLLTRAAAIPLIVNMCVAVFVAHAGQPFVSADPSVQTCEVATIYLIIYITILFTGPGRFSVDRFIWR